MAKNKQLTPTKHSTRVGGSYSGRVIACPASLKLVKKMPEKPAGEYADEGTALHNCVEHCIASGFMSTDESDLANLVGEEFYGYTMTTEQIDEAIQPALKQFDDYFAKLEEEDGDVLAYKLETEVIMPGIEGAFGTADIIMVTPKRSVVWDWKFGAGVYVECKENSQMMFYGRAAGYSAPGQFWPDGDVNAEDPDADDWPVDLVICQPRINADKPSVWTTDFGRLEQFRQDLIKKLDEAENAEEPSWARGEHCRWCNAKPICPMYKDTAMKLADAKERMAGDNPEAELPMPPKTPFTKKDLAKWMHAADIVEAWAKSIGELVMDEAKAGRAPKGFKLVEKLGNTAYVEDDNLSIDRLLGRRGLKIGERRKPWVPITPTQAIKLMKKVGKAFPDGYTERRVTGVVLVPKDDPRPRVKSTGEKAQIAGEEYQKRKDEAAVKDA